MFSKGKRRPLWLRVCLWVLCGALSLPDKRILLLRLVLFKMYCNRDSALDKLGQEHFKNEWTVTVHIAYFQRHQKKYERHYRWRECSLPTHCNEISDLNSYDNVSRAWLNPPLIWSKYFQKRPCICSPFMKESIRVKTSAVVGKQTLLDSEMHPTLPLTFCITLNKPQISEHWGLDTYL